MAERLKAPFGFALRGKQWLEHDNRYAVGLTGLLGYGAAYGAIKSADLLLLLGTDFPFAEFLPGSRVKKVQVDQNPKHIGRRTSLVTREPIQAGMSSFVSLIRGIDDLTASVAQQITNDFAS